MQVYTLNIGGLCSEITEKCLKNKGPHSLSLIVDFPNSPLPEGIYEDDRGGFFIDGDSESMDVVLNYLRGYPLPEKEDTLLRKVYFDAKRFNVTELQWDIEELINIDTPDSLVDEIHELNPYTKVNARMDPNYLTAKRDELLEKRRRRTLKTRTKELQESVLSFFYTLSDLMWPYLSLDKSKLEEIVGEREDEINEVIANYAKDTATTDAHGADAATSLLEIFLVIVCSCSLPRDTPTNDAEKRIKMLSLGNCDEEKKDNDEQQVEDVCSSSDEEPEIIQEEESDSSLDD